VPEEIRTPLSAVYEEIDSLSSSWLSISYLILEKSQTYNLKFKFVFSKIVSTTPSLVIIFTPKLTAADAQT
jgi:hypothetical protein